MKKNIVVILALLSCSMIGYAESAPAAMRVGVGLRGGAVLPYGIRYDAKQKVGGEGMLDVQYSMYWKSGTTKLGFMTGVTAGYQMTGLTMDELCYQRYQPTDCGTLFYSILTDDINEKKQTLDVEIPVMLALVADNGVFFNFGPRLAFPIWSDSKVDFTSTSVRAAMVEEGVWVTDEVITGIVEGTSVKAKINNPLLTIKVGAELGYEFNFGNRDALSVGAYLDWSAYSLYKDKDNVDFVQVTPPSNNGPAALAYNSPSDKYAKKLGSFDLGVKVIYHFNLIK